MYMYMYMHMYMYMYMYKYMYMYICICILPIKGLDKGPETFQALYVGPCPLLDINGPQHRHVWIDICLVLGCLADPLIAR